MSVTTRSHSRADLASVRHVKIGDDDLDVVFQVRLVGFLAVRGEVYLVTRSLEDVGQDDQVRSRAP